MGTLGGKIAFAVAPVIALGLVIPMMDLILGPCFFKEGCGRHETAGLAAAVLAALALAVVPALALRAVINHFATPSPD